MDSEDIFDIDIEYHLGNIGVAIDDMNGNFRYVFEAYKDPDISLIELSNNFGCLVEQFNELNKKLKKGE